MRGRAGAVPIMLFSLVALIVFGASCDDHSTSQPPARAPGSTSSDRANTNRDVNANPSGNANVGGTSNGRANVPGHIGTPGVHAPSGPTSTVPASIASDCSTDVTDALQHWIDTVPDGSVAAFRAGACYRIEGTLRVDGRHDLLFDGHGATLRAKTPGTGARLQVRGRIQFSVTNSANVTVRDLIVRGANPHAGMAEEAYQPQYEAQHAYSLIADNGVLLDGVSAYDTYGDFVYVGGVEQTPSTNITVARSRFARSGRQGISVTFGTGVQIVGNTIDDVRRSLFDLEPNRRTTGARRIEIIDNTIGAVHNYWLAAKGSGIDIGDVTVEGNVSRGTSGALAIVYGPAFGERGPFTFTNNVFRVTGIVSDENAAGAFLFAHVRGVTITGNEVFVAPSANLAAIELRATRDVTVHGNRFHGTTKTVVADAASHDVDARQ